MASHRAVVYTVGPVGETHAGDVNKHVRSESANPQEAASQSQAAGKIGCCWHTRHINDRRMEACDMFRRLEGMMVMQAVAAAYVWWQVCLAGNRGRTKVLE